LKRYPAKYAAPVPIRETSFTSPILELALRSHFSVFAAPSGYLPTARLAAAVQQRGLPLVWLRAGEEDRDPGVLLTSLIRALRKIAPAAGADTLAAMRRQPGPVGGWALLFAVAAADYNAALADGGVLVIEHVGMLAGTACIALLGAHFLPLLSESVRAVVLTHEKLPPGSFPIQAQQFRERDLQITEQTGLDLARDLSASLPERSVRRAVALSVGRMGLVENLSLASNIIGRGIVDRSIDESRSLDDLLLRMSRASISNLNPVASTTALVAVQMRDFHPEIMHSVVSANLPEGVTWLQQLSGDWQHVLCCWAPPLYTALKARQQTNPNLLHAMARQMEQEGMSEEAARFYLKLGDYPRAAETISGLASEMLDLGQWQTLESWLKRLPEPVQRDWPWLVYAGGELAAIHKEGQTARRMFSLSTELFRRQRSPEGICQSLLTESVLAAWQGDQAAALNTAHAARSEAREAGLLLYEAYADWQAGCLYADEELFETARQFFEECRSVALQAGARLVADLAVQVKALIDQRIELAQQSEQFRQRLETLKASQENVARAIQAVLSSPASNLNLLLAERGWSRIPLNLKTHSFEVAPSQPEGRGLGSLWQSLLSVFHAPPREQPTGLPAVFEPHIPITAAPPPVPQAPPAPPADEPAEQQPQVVEEEEAAPEAPPQLTAYLLGPFQLLVEDKPVAGWSGGRGRTLFQYLLANHDRPRTRDELMAVFWPESSEKAARNNLNVAVHALRQAVRGVSNLNIIIYRDGVYRINPDLSLWLDVDVFERHLDLARQADASGDQPAAIRALETATNIYRDDFLSSDPYEEWALPVRERLRLIYMEALDRLSSLYFNQGQYAAAAALCQRLLARDSCREDTHCRLMLCYTHMGERHLALRQFQICSDALRDELNTTPSPATIQLFQKIRRQG